MDTLVKTKPFTFSFSKLKNFETCPRRYHEIDVKRAWPGEESDQLSYGDSVHKAMAGALQGKPLPAAHSVYQPWIDKFKRTEGELLVECKWAITRDFKPTPWMSSKVWLRGIADAAIMAGDYATVVDWKTGKSRNADPVQLTLTALIMFIQYPELQCIRADFVWLPEDMATSQVLFRSEAAKHWAAIIPRAERLEKATEENNFPPTPNFLCEKWCPVKTCPFWGK
jgi:hypothetical protein